MKSRTILSALGLAGLQALCVPLCRAGGLDTYNTRSSFDSAVSSGFQPLNVANFDSIPSGTLLPNGSAVGGGVTLSYTPLGGGPPNELDVISGLSVGLSTTSGLNYLGATTTGGPTSPSDVLYSGDQLTISFVQPEQAMGLYILTGGQNQPGDFTLNVGGVGSVSTNGVTDPAFDLVPGLNPNNGTWVYFLGLVDTNPGQTFTSVTLETAPANNYSLNIDDIVSTAASPVNNSVPDEASTLGLLFSVCAGLLSVRRWRRA